MNNMSAIVDAFSKMQFSTYDDMLEKAEALFKKGSDEGGIDFTKFLYNGYDPATFLKNLALKYKKKGAEESFLPHTIIVCYLFATRGTKIGKIVDRTGEDGKKVLNEIIKACELNDSTKNPLSVTVGRWACSFPTITGMIMKKDHGGLSRMVCDEYGLPSWLAIPGILGLFDPQFMGVHLCRVACAMYFVYSELLTLYISEHVKNAEPMVQRGKNNQTIVIMNASLGKAVADGEISKEHLVKMGIVKFEADNHGQTWGGVYCIIKAAKKNEEDDEPAATPYGMIRLAGYLKVEKYINKLYTEKPNVFVELKTFLDSLTSTFKSTSIDLKDYHTNNKIWEGCEKDTQKNKDSKKALMHDLIVPTGIQFPKKPFDDDQD